jgi:hypothetical protein
MEADGEIAVQRTWKRRPTIALLASELNRGLTMSEVIRQDTGPGFHPLLKVEGDEMEMDKGELEEWVPLHAGVNSSLWSTIAALRQRYEVLPAAAPNRQPSTTSTIEIDEETLKSVLNLRPKTPYERIDDYNDPFPCLSYRKTMRRLNAAVRQLCSVIVHNVLFESLIILVIIWNTVLLALEDPSLSMQPDPYYTMDLVLLYIYTVEMALKVIALGFVFGKTAYLKDYWNILDFVIVLTGWIDLKYAQSGVNLTALRAFRLLRPLRSVTRIQGMRVIFLSLVGSLKLLLSSIALLLFFYLIASIASLQMFMGAMRYRCMDLATGIVLQDDSGLCGDCSPTQVCVKGLSNPEHGTTHFDNLLLAMITTFQCVTLEGWSSVMNDLQRVFGMWIALFFIPIVFIGAFFFMNLTLVAMKSSVSAI